MDTQPVQSKIPTLNTERLLLRPFALTDAADVQRLAGDYDIARMTKQIEHPYPDGLAEMWIKTHSEEFCNGTAVHYAITSKADGQLIGAISLTNISQQSAHAEMGYWVGKPFWNNGYCTEAGKMLLQYGFSELKLNRIYAHCMSRNPASGKVMQKMGMKHEGIQRQHFKKWGEFVDLEYYGILKSEFSS